MKKGRTSLLMKVTAIIAVCLFALYAAIACVPVTPTPPEVIVITATPSSPPEPTETPIATTSLMENLEWDDIGQGIYVREYTTPSGNTCVIMNAYGIGGVGRGTTIVCDFTMSSRSGTQE